MSQHLQELSHVLVVVLPWRNLNVMHVSSLTGCMALRRSVGVELWIEITILLSSYS